MRVTFIWSIEMRDVKLTLNYRLATHASGTKDRSRLLSACLLRVLLRTAALSHITTICIYDFRTTQKDQ